MWLAWLVGHAVLVVPPTWAYLADGYGTVPYDVRIYADWGASLVAGDGLPSGDERWQYPPGAAAVFALPAAVDRLVGLPYPAGFVIGMLAISAAVTGLLLRRCSAGAAGLWAVGVWAIGQVGVARFDLVPAACAVVAVLAASERRWTRTGWAVGVGALAKVWPVILVVAIGRSGWVGRSDEAGLEGDLDARRDREAKAKAKADDDGEADADDDGEADADADAKADADADGQAVVEDRAKAAGKAGGDGAMRGVRDVITLGAGLAGAVVGLVGLAFAVGWWRDLFGFVGAQQARGLQLEAVAATPIVLARAFGGGEDPTYAYGSMQFDSPLAQAAATGCSLAGAVLAVVAVAWWWGLGRTGGTSVADRCFALTTLVIVTFRVLSPQYLLWLLAVAACRSNPWDAGSATPVWRRPAVLLLAAALLSQLVYPMMYDGLLAGDLVPSLLLAARNGLLVVLSLVAVRPILPSRAGSSKQER